MKRFSDRFIQASIAAWTIVGATACRPLDADTAQVQAKRIEQLQEGSAAVVHLDQGRLAAIRVELVGLESAPGNVRATGKVQLDENLVARIVAPLSGRVTNLDVKLGDQVRRGQPLFLLDSRDAAEALETHAASHRDLDLAEKTLTMTQDLFDHQAASRIALEQARTDVEKARTRVERTERALEAIGVRPDEESDRLNPSVPVTSPIDGVVIDRHLSNGQYVQADSTPLLTVAKPSTVLGEADVFEHDVHALRLGPVA